MVNELRIMKPKVSIMMITYGHEKYIQEAINGVFKQKTDFLIELIIANDKSPDSSDKLIINKIEECPANISVKYILNEYNMGANANFSNAYSKAEGEYIACCEGDDYWTDPLKLQKQVDFLEANPEYVLCFHDVQILQSNGKIVDDFITALPEQYEERITLAKKLNYIHTPSVAYRNILHQDEINSFEFLNSPIGDYFLYMTLTKYGKIGYIPETMAVYRHGVGTFSSLNVLKSIKANLLLFANLYSFEKDEEIKEIFFRHLQECIGQIDNEFRNIQFENSKFKEIFSSKRHKMIDRIFSFLGL